MADKQCDNFCWECHQSGTSLSCSKCVIRTFHSKCIKKSDRKNVVNGKWMCPPCFKAQLTSKDKQTELDMLPMIIDQVWNDESFDSIKDILNGIYPETDSTDVIVNPISLTSIKDNIKSYATFDAFLADIHWIHHNCVILYSKKNVKTHTAALLVNFFNDEIASVQSCIECYSNAINHPDHWFSMACEEPHLVLWAKLKGFPYWPVKLMCVDDYKGTLHVRFFGQHENSEVSPQNCCLYSNKNPDQSGYNSKDYNLAMEDVKRYLNNIEKKFGVYKLATSKTPVNILRIDQYMLDFIPGMGRYREAKPPASKKRKIDESNIASADMADDKLSPTSSKNAQLAENIQVSPSTSSARSDSTHVKAAETKQEVHSTSMEQSIVNEPISAKLKDSITKAPISEAISNFSTPTTMTTSYHNMDSAENVHKFVQIKQMNAKLENDLAELERTREIGNKVYEDINENLLKQIKTLKQMHLMELNRLNGKCIYLESKIWDINNERQQTLDLMAQQHSLKIQEAKNHTYCAVCDKSKPLNTFVCGEECQLNFWKR